MSNFNRISKSKGNNWAEKVKNFKKSPEQQFYRNKIRGSLIGGAAGDALGYAVEFMRLREIKSRYGEKGITSYELNKKGKAIISDDTQMTLFTANGLLFGQTRACLRGIGAAPHYYVECAYKDWLATQTGQERWNEVIQERPNQDYGRTGEYLQYTWLYNVPELHVRRAPGMTCLSALKSGQSGRVDRPINDSKGCGGVMRVAPMGLFCGLADDAKIVIEEGAEIAALTHGHNLGWLPAAVLAELLRHIVYDRYPSDYSLKEAVETTITAVENIYYRAEYWIDLKRLLISAIQYAENDRPDEECIRELGEGWVAEEALAVAVYCAVKYSSNFSDCIIAAVNHDGDSDSTGAIAGNILGVWLGYKQIEKKWLDNLEIKSIILEIADDLCDGCPMSEMIDYDDRDWSNKYIYCLYAGKRRKMRQIEKRREK